VKISLLIHNIHGVGGTTRTTPAGSTPT